MSNNPMVVMAPQTGETPFAPIAPPSIVTWADADGIYEGQITVDIPNRTWWLKGAGYMVYTENGINPRTGQKFSVQRQVYVPDLAGTIRWAEESTFGWTRFTGLIDIPGFSPMRADDVVGGFGFGKGSVSINLFGHVFLIRGEIQSPPSGAEVSGQSNQGGNG